MQQARFNKAVFASGGIALLLIITTTTAINFVLPLSWVNGVLFKLIVPNKLLAFT